MMTKVEMLVRITYDLEGYWDTERGETVVNPEKMLEMDLRYINKVGLVEFINGGVDEDEIELVESRIISDSQ